MKRDAIDFHAVPEHQLAMDARLHNWAREQRRGTGAATSPMFRQYRSSDQWGEVAVSVPTDSRDAARINAAWKQLPADHRHATHWHYITPGAGPVKACRKIGCTKDELARLVIDARQMLINRRA